MTDWKSLDDHNLQVFDQLVATLATGQAIAFVGAGASIPVGYPSWPRLLEILARQAVTDPARREALLDDTPQSAAGNIRRLFESEGAFAAELRRIFGPLSAADGVRFSGAHGSLLKLPFRGYVTTNYDPCLDAARSRLRPGSPGGLVTWKDTAAARWRTGTIFDEHPCPILWAHGHYEHAESIVFDLDGYRRAYLSDEGTAYRGVFGRLWAEEQLVFVGYGFSDPWLQFLVDREITLSGQKRTEAPRHVAIMGYSESRLAALPDQRRAFADQCHARLLAYTVRKSADGEGEDHSELTAILDALVQRVAPTAHGPPATPTPPITTFRPTSGEILARYRELLESDHEKLHGPLKLPAGMDVLEHAYVDVQVATRDAERLYDLLTAKPTLDDMLERPIGDPAWQRGRWLLVGDPGSGKTTLLRRLTARLAAREDRLPVYQPLSALVAFDGDPLAFWEDRFRARRRTSGLDFEIQLAGDNGRLVLLLDGYDEVPPDRRQRADDLIEGLELQWPQSRLVVATRPHGRSVRVPAGFVELSLLPLDDGSRRGYLEAWLSAEGEADPVTRAQEIERDLTGDRGINELSRNPLYLTLLAGIWTPDKPLPKRRSALYDSIFDHLYEGSHKPRRERWPLPARSTVDATLVDLAYGWTDREQPEEYFAALESWLLDEPRRPVWSRLQGVATWRDGGPRRFFLDVWDRTQILGPRDDAEDAAAADTPWRFSHRTFREALAAKRLFERYRDDGEQELLAWARGRDEGRWAEPLSLLAGRLDRPDNLLTRLAESNSALALRALATAQGVSRDTLVSILKLTNRPEERAAVFESIPDQLRDAPSCLALWDQLIEARRDLNDVYFLHWLLDEVVRRWSSYRAAARDRLARLYATLPEPTDPELFRSIVTQRDGRVGLWCRIPEGEGWIGSPDFEEGRFSDEGPRYAVRFEKPYWMAAAPVTNAQWAQLDTPTVDVKNPESPAIQLTWWEAMTFCSWLEHKLGLSGARLPTEEEWEYACRAGTETRHWSGNSEADLERVGWYDGNSEMRLHSSGEKESNEFGLYDVHGNVREWTASMWSANYRRREGGVVADPATEPYDLAASPRSERVLRGGCCWSAAIRARSAYRNFREPWVDPGHCGFRVLLPFPPSQRSE